jgi:NO-binding membrane sensor protein with MHYT domain
MLEISYVPYLVIASVAVAIMGAFTSLRLTSGLAVLDAHRRKVRITQAAFALGGGIWSMHFVGMLSVEFTIPIFYDPLRTLGSALIAILLTGSALMTLHFGTRTPVRIAFAGLVTAIGIVSMHYLGMSAISGNCIVSYDTGGVMLAIGIAMLSCILAMELAYRKRSLLATIGGSIVLGLSISAMHYSAMMFTVFSVSDSVNVTMSQTISSNNLALFVAVAAFVICGLFLLTAVTVEKARSDAVTNGPAVMVAPEAQRNEANRNRNVSASLSRAFDGGHSVPDEQPGLLTRVPYERDKTMRFLSTETIVFVQADGHYSRIANGENEYFCPWSISRLEKDLGPANFIRTHRSYLVNKNHINGFRREGDKAVCIVGAEKEMEIPVSRGRVSEIQQMLGI